MSLRISGLRIDMRVIDDRLSRKFRNMAFACSLLVVLIHALPAMGSVVFSRNTIGLWFACEFFKQGICQIAVPFFFFAAGFFLAGRTDDPFWYRKALKKRFWTLVIPYCIFDLAYWVWIKSFGGFASVLGGGCFWSSFDVSVGSLLTVAGFALQKPFLGLLWFVRCLILLVLISPFVVALTRNRRVGVVWLGVCFVAYGALSPSAWPGSDWAWVLFYDFTLMGLFWFSAGMFLRRNPLKVRISPAVCLASGLGLLALNVLARKVGLVGSVYLGWLSLPFLMYGLWAMMPTSFALEYAFPIYILHRFFLTPYQALVKASLAGSVGGFAFSVLTAVVCIVVLKKIAPKFSAVVFGGR